MSIKEFLDQVWQKAPDHEVEAGCARVWKRIESELEKHDTSLWSLYGDGWNAEPLNQRELQVLTAAAMLGEGSDMGRITELVAKWTGRHHATTLGFVYATLGGLAERGLIKLHNLAALHNNAEP